jgi:hypothetical protein
MRYARGPLSSLFFFRFNNWGGPSRITRDAQYFARAGGSPIIFLIKNKTDNVCVCVCVLYVRETRSALCVHARERFSSGNFSAPATRRRVRFDGRLPVFFCTRPRCNMYIIYYILLWYKYGKSFPPRFNVVYSPLIVRLICARDTLERAVYIVLLQ